MSTSRAASCHVARGRIGSLFSGIGGLEMALEAEGCGETAWQVEREDFQRSVLAKHWPDAVRYEDVTTVDWSAVEPVETICGGFPCQPFSEAGNRQGVLDERWMWPAMADAVRVVGPRYVVVENVAALLRDRAAFGRVLSDLHELGFDAEWSVVPACAVGAPHSRPRVYLVAYPEGDHVPDQGARGAATREAGQPEPRGGRSGSVASVDSRWLPEPEMDRVAHGLPRWLVREPLEALGNAVVPRRRPSRRPPAPSRDGRTRGGRSMTRAGDGVTNVVCYCGRYIRSADGKWTHADDGSTRCYPDEPRDAEMVAEPDSNPLMQPHGYTNTHPDWCKCQRVCGGDQ